MEWEWVLEYLKGMEKPAAAATVVAVAVMLSHLQGLGLEGEIVYSIFRAFFQLSIIGFVLQFIFNQQNAIWILIAYLFMVSIAAHTAGQRAKHVPRGKHIAGLSIIAGTSVTMFSLILLKVFPFTPMYFIPFAGMLTGRAMTATGDTMKRLREDIKIQINIVETALTLGATPRQAIAPQVKRTLVLALSPVLDNTKTIGLINLPGTVMGLILGGASPVEAIKFQMIVTCMFIVTTTVSSSFSTYLCCSSFFTKACQLERTVFLAD